MARLTTMEQAELARLDRAVLDEYRAIHALPFEQMLEELDALWTPQCSKDAPCMECRREELSLKEAGYTEEIRGE